MPTRPGAGGLPSSDVPPTGDPLADPRLRAVLADAQRLGFLGDAPLDDHVAHAAAFVAEVAPGDHLADLGSGGGLPGLVIAVARPGVRVHLIEASERRADHLRRSVAALDLSARVVVDGRPAEQVGRDAELRATFDVVTARGFGPPAVVAECAAPLLRVGGRLLVSEPPGSDGARWVGLDVSPLPLSPVAIVAGPPATLACLVLEEECPPRFPRAVGVSARRPLF